MTARRRLAELRLALMLLTRLPAGRLRPPVPTIAAAGWAFPLCGAAIGALGWAGYAAAAAMGLPPAICATLAVGVLVAITGALHEDGLADFADGMGGGDRATRLAIMRDSRLGSFGAVALILALALRALAIAALGATGMLLSGFVATAAASRFLALLAMALLPPAREAGLGRQASGGGGKRLLAALALTVLAVAPLGPAAPAVAAAMTLAAAAVAALAARRLGGQTGDVLGAVQAVAEVCGWIALVAVAAPA